MALSTEWVALKIGQSGSGGVEYSADLIEWIESQDSVKEYLLSLVRKDIEKSKKKEKKKKPSNK